MGIEGHNPSGHCFVVSKLIDSIPVSVDDQLPCAKKQAIDNEEHQNSNTSQRVLSSVSSYPIIRETLECNTCFVNNLCYYMLAYTNIYYYLRSLALIVKGMIQY